MSRVLRFTSLLLVVGIGVLVYVVTKHPSQEDPCVTPLNDISAAILGEDADQDALANRAMLQRRLCEKHRQEQAPD